MAGRYIGPTDASLWKAFNKGLDLLSSDAIDSDRELLDLVKKAKQELEREASHPPKKLKLGKGIGDMEQHASGHCLGSVLPLSDHCGAESLGSGGGEVNSSTGGGSGVSLLMGARLLHSVQSGTARGRLDKPRRKMTR